MYLKNIEVQGFKSFANKIDFEFHNGITCIVGPNGSGKSNVADAVRWVLGEQSAKQLRGASMQDVIFSGTETRKAQGYAYVAITLDNSDHRLNVDYEEVTVSRCVYRSGESEYKINNTICRLRDVHELFYDTGIGKEGYSIIGQGQIDKILSNKPEERRELFDEAVGIVKYKRRKQVTLKKLTSARDNLLRLSDIMSELERQVGPLEKQSTAAKTYLALYEKLKKLEINLFVLDSRMIKAELEELSKRKKIVDEDLATSQQDLEKLKIQNADVNEKLKEIEDKIDTNRDISSNLAVEKNTLQGQIDVLTEQIKADEANSLLMNNRLKDITEAIERLDDERKKHEYENDKLNSLAQQEEEEVSSAKEELQRIEKQIDEIHNAIENDKKSIISLLNEKSDLGAKLQHFETMIENSRVRREEFTAKILDKKSEEEKHSSILRNAEKEHSRIREEMVGLRSALDTYNRKKSMIQNELSVMENTILDKKNEYHALKIKSDSLKNLEERYEGYGQSIKRVMEARSKLGKVHGVVADLIKVDARYEVAIEIALGGAIQNVVTQDQQTAKNCINYLKSNKYGRATFLPLEEIKNQGAFSKPEALKEVGAIGVASSLVKVDPLFKNVKESLLGRILVVDTLDHAASIARKYHSSIRIVTLEGELLSQGGAMTGGTFRNTSNLLGRKNEISQLDEEAKTILKEYDDLLLKQKEVKDNLQAATESYEKYARSLQEKILKENDTRLRMDQAKERLEEVRILLADLTNEKAEFDQVLKEARDEKKQIETAIFENANQNTSSEETVSQSSVELTQLQKRKETISQHIIELQLDYQKMIQSSEFADENHKRILGEISKLSMESATITESLKENTANSLARNEGILAIRESILEKETLIGEADKIVQSFTKQREELKLEQSDFFAQLDSISGRINKLNLEVVRIDTQMENKQKHLHTQTNVLWDEYETMPSEAIAAFDDSFSDMPSMRREIAGYKAEIKALGNVNINAIEDYKEVSERYEEYKFHYDDLIKGEEELVKAIDELDTGMRQQFNEQFAKIQVEFHEVFKQLFGGGHASLHLVEGEDVIDAGIQIISQPPGKKLQNMMQLSGGEKALTAIALLFAIQNLKPSPFCLLDEIEAALDDSNVTRFAKYLHKLTKHTQFILISHRRGTMVLADRLYGITMQEKGVSALVSVSLIEQELDE